MRLLQGMVVIICMMAYGNASCQEDAHPVFISGQEGYNTYRIPAIIALPGGELLAFCEGRVNGAADFGNVDIVMKRSTDQGKTWGTLQHVVDNDVLQAGNPAPVVDLTDKRFPKGRIFLFYNTGNKNETEIRKGNGYKQVWYITSTDGGHTWSKAEDITLQVHKPNRPEVNPAYRFPEDWRTYATVPGHAIQFTEGKYKGRIYVAANHTAGNIQPGFANGRAHGYYSDDHGITFHLSEDVNVPGGNESTAAALSGNRLVMNSRNQKGNVKARIVSYSSDGGQTWDTSYYDHQLPDPVNEASILAIGKRKGKTILAFSNAADTAHRDNLTLRISFDEGISWPKSFLVDKAAVRDGRKDHTAYSDLVNINKRQIGILYERDNYSAIVFRSITWQ